MPPDPPGDGLQLGVTLGEIKTDVGWIKQQLQTVLPDHEKRIHQGEIDRATDRGARDMWARALALVAVLAAVAAAIAAWIALSRHH